MPLNQVIKNSAWLEISLPWWLSGKEFPANAEDTGLIPESGRSHGEGNGNLLQYSCLENSMDRRAGQAAVHGLPELDMIVQLSHTTYT